MYHPTLVAADDVRRFTLLLERNLPDGVSEPPHVGCYKGSGERPGGSLNVRP
jgi:hypothetical protein